jgi:hypothetical protein
MVVNDGLTMNLCSKIARAWSIPRGLASGLASCGDRAARARDKAVRNLLAGQRPLALVRGSDKLAAAKYDQWRLHAGKTS